MSARLTILGSGTCQIQKHRMASSVLLEEGSARLVFDLGHGITQRLHEVGLKNNDVEHIVFSHFHPDHVSDVIPFLQAGVWSRIDPRTKDLNLYGPHGVEVQMMRFLSLFGPDDIACDRFKVKLNELLEPKLTLCGWEFEWCDLPPAGNHGIKGRVGNTIIAITGDSSFHEQEIDFLHGVDLAVIDSGHPTDEEILQLAVATQTPRIVLSHLYREINESEINALGKKQGYKGKFIVAQDLMSFEI